MDSIMCYLGLSLPLFNISLAKKQAHAGKGNIQQALLYIFFNNKFRVRDFKGFMQ